MFTVFHFPSVYVMGRKVVCQRLCRYRFIEFLAINWGAERKEKSHQILVGLEEGENAEGLERDGYLSWRTKLYSLLKGGLDLDVTTSFCVIV